MPPLDQFILFGDSLTQGVYDQSAGFSLGAKLQSDYIRRLDVINRGFSGYNTDHALEVMERTIPTTTQANVRFLAIWFGANDCNKDTTWNQYVPLERFKANLLAIINHPLMKAQSPKIILITQPPVEETVLEELLRPQDSSVTRKAVDAQAYAEAVKEVAVEANVKVVDTWSAFMKRTSWEGGNASLPGSKELGKDPVLADLLPDGLHLNGKGYRIVYDELKKLIIDAWPDQDPWNMSFSQKVKWEIDMGSEFWDINHDGEERESLDH